MPRLEVTTTKHHLVIQNLGKVAAALCMEGAWIAKVRGPMWVFANMCAATTLTAWCHCVGCVLVLAQYLSVSCGARCKVKKDGSAHLSVGHATSMDRTSRASQVKHFLAEFIDKYVFGCVWRGGAGFVLTAWGACVCVFVSLCVLPQVCDMPPIGLYECGMVFVCGHSWRPIL